MNVKKVIVVSKTHLDVGFTNYAQSVLDKYVLDFIPKSVNLAFKLNSKEKKQFVWTTGAYLIKYALEHCTQENAELLKKAIKLGYVRYHALPLTTHSELMSREIFLYGISIARNLDKEFGLNTIASKMTDVPGHTKSIVPVMADNGIKYLHIGVNSSSRVPGTPEIFRWESEGRQIAVSYNGDYAKPLVLQNGSVLEMLHTHDNFGPPTEQEVKDFYKVLEKKYPDAEISAGTLDDFAYEIEKVWDTLPVVDEEIGDTWIHGVATDPKKTSDFRRLAVMADRWIKEGMLVRESKEYCVFMENMLLVAEHTWGMDVKKYLLDFTNWSKKDFLKAIKEDVTDYSYYGKINEHIFQGMKQELKDYRGDNEKSSYSIFTSSHLEQRDYIRKAIEALPKELSKEAEKELDFEFPIPEKPVPFIPENIVVIKDWTISFGTDGCLKYVKNDRLKLDKHVILGEFGYQSFSGETVKKCFLEYGRDLYKNFHWAECDFGKPGLEYEKSVEDGYYKCVPVFQDISDDSVTVFMCGNVVACEKYGCPREVAVRYTFLDTKIDIQLFWRRKDPVRSPEALWFGFNLYPLNSNRIRFQKLGEMISPCDVIFGGNRKLHAVECIEYKAATDCFEIKNIDTPVVSVGGMHLYDVDCNIENPGNGLYFLLCNNRWGTNFPQWYSEDARCEFEVTIG